MSRSTQARTAGQSGNVTPAGLAVWNLGFRPFYLLASGFAAASIALWVLQYAGILAIAYLHGAAWHGHEMIFGYALAVIAGFLFTAVRNWTGRPTPSGGWLIAVCTLWLAGRVLVLSPFGLAAALVSAAFPIAVGIGIAVPLVQSGNKRNYFFVGLLVLMGAADLVFNLSMLGVLGLPARPGLQAGLDVILFVMAVMGGRVIPMFTNNGVPGANARRHATVEKLALGSTIVLLVADVLPMPTPALALIALACAVAHGARLALWDSGKTLGTPLVWILHAAYAWIVIHLALRGFAALGWVPEPLAIHALTIGAIGGLTIGMMTRTARGHSGLPLVADRAEVACYLLVQLAAAVRVLGPLVAPSAYLTSVIASGALWSAAFALYFVRYWPILTRPRLDGKPG
jgi:uncharacterized protein involved in response to NO